MVVVTAAPPVLFRFMSTPVVEQVPDMVILSMLVLVLCERTTEAQAVGNAFAKVKEMVLFVGELYVPEGVLPQFRRTPPGSQVNPFAVAEKVLIIMPVVELTVNELAVTLPVKVLSPSKVLSPPISNDDEEMATVPTWPYFIMKATAIFLGRVSAEVRGVPFVPSVVGIWTIPSEVSKVPPDCNPIFDEPSAALYLS